MAPPQTRNSAFRTHLVLGRVSNLPTVWSNCLAGWALAGGELSPAFLITTIGISLIYTGGMYLNDAVDAAYDAEHGIDRPIVRGEISRRTALILAIAFLALGLVAIGSQGWPAFGSALALVALVALYDLCHKKIRWSPLIMASCRAMVYVTVAFASREGLGRDSIFWSLALAGYIVGLTFVARVENRNYISRLSPLALMSAPPILLLSQGVTAARAIVSAAFAGWLLYCLIFVFNARIRNLRRAVGAMLAGICMVDFLAVSHATDSLALQGSCLGLFLCALVFQKYVPAT